MYLDVFFPPVWKKTCFVSRISHLSSAWRSNALACSVSVKTSYSSLSLLHWPYDSLDFKPSTEAVSITVCLAGSGSSLPASWPVAADGLLTGQLLRPASPWASCQTPANTQMSDHTNLHQHVPRAVSCVVK